MVQYVYQNKRKAVTYDRGHEGKWDEAFSIELQPNFWKEACSNNFKCCTETLLRSFQYSILLNTLPANSYLFKCCLVQSDKCYYCNEIRKLFNTFCGFVQEFLV